MSEMRLETPEPERPASTATGRPLSTDGRLLAMRRAAHDLPTYPATSPEKATALRAICARHPGCTTHTHRQRLLDAVSSLGQISVPECREFLGLSNPPQTVRELMSHGGVIVHSTDVTYTDREGNLRRTVAYELAHD